MGHSRRVKRKIKDKSKIGDGVVTADPIYELGGIIADTREITEHARAQKDKLEAFITSVTDKGAPKKVMDAVKYISTALGNEVDKIDTAQSDYRQIQDDLKKPMTTAKGKFDLEAAALDLATTTMQASVNIGTILEDLEKARAKILDPAPEALSTKEA